MTITKELYQQVKSSVDFPTVLQQLQHDWEEEQINRHEFWKKHDDSQKAEFINGIGVYHSQVYGRHWMASSNITRNLLPFVYNNKLGKVAYEKVLCRFTRNDYEPDIAFWNKQISDTFLPTQSAFPPPNFIIEILSESTQERDRDIKFEDYAAHEVAEYWIVDPVNNTVEQYFLNNKMYELHLKIQEGKISSRAIIGFEILVADIFNEN